MTQLKSEAAGTRAAPDVSAGGALPGVPRAGKRRGRGNMVAAAAALAAVVLAACYVAGVGTASLRLVQGAVAVIAAAYLVAVVFKLAVVFAGATTAPRPGAAGSAARQVASEQRVPDGAVPLYTVLVPLVDSGGPPDAAAIDVMIEALAALDYPAERLQVLLLADEDHRPRAALPVNFEIVGVGSANRAAACAVGLARARGELCVVYDIGQRPDPGQLRTAAAAFGELPAWVVCVRPEMRREAPDTGWLPKCVAAESAVSSALFLRGLDRLELPMPLGGSSCHVRTEALRRLGLWGAEDHAEGADLGVRIARRGWRARMIASVTNEAADRDLGRWLRKRTTTSGNDHRTWLAHIRTPHRLFRDLGPVRFVGMQLTAAMSMLTVLANPVFWIVTLAWLVLGSGQITQVFPLQELAAVVAIMLLGNLINAYSLMVGCMAQGRFAAVAAMLLAPLYWALMSLAAYRALFFAIRPVPAQKAVPSVAAS